MEDSSEQQHPDTFDSNPMRWPEQHSYPHSYHGTPAQEYQNFGWGSPSLPMHSVAFSQSPPPRPSHQQLQPLMMPWPSMLGSQQTYYPPLLPQTQVSTTSPPTVTPVSAGSSTRSGPSVRKTLSDDDRRRMCKYAEDNPAAKQTEIGYLFGVERSTVSKVLRKKDVYLNQAPPKEGPLLSPPNKRSKARMPDIEKTLAAWVIKEQNRGSSITDEAIHEQAHYFASIPGPENPALNPINHPGWLDKFKQKHRINNKAPMSKAARKDSVADPDNIQSPNTTGISPTSPSDEIPSSNSPDTMDTTEDSKPTTLNTKRRKSPPSIDTAFNDLGSPSTCFTPQLLSPTSPFFSPSSQLSQPLHSPLSSHQAFPALHHFVNSSPSNSETLSPHSHFLSSVDEGVSEMGRLLSIDECMEETSPSASRNSDAENTKTINPETVSRFQLKNELLGNVQRKPSSDEARQALKIVLEFFEDQPNGFLELQEGMMLGRLIERLSLLKA